MANPVIPQPFAPGLALQDGSALNSAMANDIAGSQYAITAAGTGQATGYQLTQPVNYISTVAAGTFVNLPRAIQGAYALVFNYGANTLGIGTYLATDTIDGVIGTTGTTLTAAHRGALFYCVSPGVWISFLLGAVSS
jgi:hypothetical protein